MAQKMITGFGSSNRIEELLNGMNCKKFLLVHDDAFAFLPVKSVFDAMPIPHVAFDGFTSNPLYEDVCKGVELFRNEGCDAIVAVGGGSSIDVAKCIKLYCNMDSSRNYLNQEPKDSGVPLIAVPTTAGTGSESTRFAVIYYEGKKQSVASDFILPDCVILDPTLLKTLPLYQKKCTMLDALCQGIESWWSINANAESKKYAQKAVETIIANMDAYLAGDENAAEKIMLAANNAGCAINITQTTAPHAMSYKLTSLYHLPHGHAVAICLPAVWRAMLSGMDRCVDSHGAEYLNGIFNEIAEALGADSPAQAIVQFEKMLAKLDMTSPKITQSEMEMLAASVNPVRLKNNPVAFTEDELRSIYAEIAVK